jgi:glyoxylase-like metal-dependent hydrolase (beta-lactamase superfamily II)
MSGTAVAAASAALAPIVMPTPARAVAPLAGKQAPSFYRYKVGDDEVTVIHDGARSFPMPDTFVKNVSKDEALAAAEAAYMPKGMVTVPFNPTVVNTGSKLVLIDSGYGPNIAPTVGLLPANMAAAGIDPKQIDIIVLSHLHPDHINGILATDGSLAFPQAEIKVPALDWGLLE